jgi:hypothetical protein
MKWTDLMDMFKKASTSVSTSTTVVYPDALSPIPLISSTTKTQEDPDDPEPEDEGDIL